MVSLTLVVLALNLRLMISGMAQEAQAPSVNKLIELFIILPFFFYLLAGAVTGRLILRKSGITVPLLAFTALVLLSVFQASYFAASYRFALTLLFHSAFFFLVFHFSVSQKFEKILLCALLSSAVIACFIAIYQYLFIFGQVREYYQQYPATAMVTQQMRAAFEERLSQNKVFATFFLSTTLCGFLTMILPVPLLLFLSSLRKANFKWSASTIPAVLSAIILIAIALTGSKGGWLALIASLFLIAFYYLFVRKKRRLRIASFWRAAGISFACIIGLCVLLYFAGYAWLFSSLYHKAYIWLVFSTHVRIGYWLSALRMIFANLLGVGAANFADNYPLYKLPWAGEVKMAHNSYLEICAEFGILGLVSYLAMWLLAARRLLKPLPDTFKTASLETADIPAGEKTLTFWAAIGGILSFALFYCLGLFFSIPYSLWNEVVLWAVLWLILFLLLSRKNIFDSPVLPVALAAGLLSFLLHSVMDFDFSSHGINLTVMVVLALLLAHHLRKKALAEKGYIVGRPVLLPATFALAALIIICALLYLPGSLLSDYLQDEASHKQLDASLVLKDDPRAVEKALTHFSDAARMLEKAKSTSPDKRKTYMELAGIYQFMFNLLRSQQEGERDQRRIEECFDKALSNYTVASRLAPLTHSVFYCIALLYISHSDPLTKSDADKAFEAAKEAVRLYPTRPQYHVLLGALYRGLYEAQGGEEIKEKMLFHYAEALRLSKEAPWSNYWLKIPESDAAEIEQILRGEGK